MIFIRLFYTIANFEKRQGVVISKFQFIHVLYAIFTGYASKSLVNSKQKCSGHYVISKLILSIRGSYLGPEGWSPILALAV